MESSVVFPTVLQHGQRKFNPAGHAQLQGFCVVIFPANETVFSPPTLSRPLTPRNSPWQTLKGLLISMPLPQVSNPLALYTHSFN